MSRNLDNSGTAPLRFFRERSRSKQRGIAWLRDSNRERLSLLYRERRFGDKGILHSSTEAFAGIARHAGAKAEGRIPAVVQALLDASPANLAVLDEAGTVLHVNHAWRHYAKQYGLVSHDCGVGFSYVEVWQEVLGSAAAADDLAEGIQRILAGTESLYHNEYFCARPPASRWVQVRAARFDLPNSNGGFRVLVTHEEIPPGNVETDAVPDGEKHLRRVLNHLLAFVAVLTPDGTLIEGNRAPLEKTEELLDELQGTKIWDCYWWGGDSRIRTILYEGCVRAAGGETTRRDIAFQTHDGRNAVLDFMLAPAVDDQGRVTCLIASAVDITERKHMEQELRELSGRLIGIQEAERRRIARELHDDLSQRLAILSIEMQQLDQAIPQRKASLHTSIREMWTRTQEINGDIHRLSYQLHPSKLDHLGLMAAIKDCCDEFSEYQGLTVEFRHKGFPAALPKDVALCLFRVAQESLHNVVKHSGAAEALVVLEKVDGAVRLSVSDDGCGFDPESARANGGLGLISMRERLRLVGGEIFISSQVSQGTQVNVTIPLTIS